MSADTPTILATSGGLTRGRWTMFGFGPLLHYAIELAGVSGRAPRVCYVGTAGGDQESFEARFIDAGTQAPGVSLAPACVEKFRRSGVVYRPLKGLSTVVTVCSQDGKSSPAGEAFLRLARAALKK